MRTLKKIIKCRICGKEKNRTEVRLRINGSIKDRICKTCHINFLDALKKKNGYVKLYHKYRRNFCEKCGYKNKKEFFDIHHIDKNRLNNSKNNLITLCPNCHRLEHIRKIIM